MNYFLLSNKVDVIFVIKYATRLTITSAMARISCMRKIQIHTCNLIQTHETVYVLLVLKCVTQLRVTHLRHQIIIHIYHDRNTDGNNVDMLTLELNQN